MSTVKTVLIKATHPEQGQFVVINEKNFDPKKHELYEMPAPPPVAPPSATPPTPPVDPLAVLPANWKEQSLAVLAPIVQSVTGRTAETHDQAVVMIEAAIAEKSAA